MKFVCAADCGVDRYTDRGLERPGGIGLNVVVHLRRQCAPGDDVMAVAPIGDDAGQAIVLDALARAGVVPRLEVVRGGATPVQHIRHAPGGERVFERYDEGVLAGFRVSRRQQATIAGCDVLATTAFGQGLAFFESVMAARRPGLRAVDFTNANDVGDPVAFAARWAPELDVGLFGLQPSDSALIDELEEVARGGHCIFVITLGAAGAVALGRPERIRCPAQDVREVVDTTGAGDAFTAGFLCEYARGRDIERSLARGTAVAASTLGSSRLVRAALTCRATILAWRRTTLTAPSPRRRRATASCSSPHRSTGCASRATSGSSAWPRPGATRRWSRPVTAALEVLATDLRPARRRRLGAPRVAREPAAAGRPRARRDRHRDRGRRRRALHVVPAGRARALPARTPLGFDIARARGALPRSRATSDPLSRGMPAKGFGFGGVPRERAYHDALLDLATPAMGHPPLVRIAALGRRRRGGLRAPSRRARSRSAVPERGGHPTRR